MFKFQLFTGGRDSTKGQSANVTHAARERAGPGTQGETLGLKPSQLGEAFVAAWTAVGTGLKF